MNGLKFVAVSFLFLVAGPFASAQLSQPTRPSAREGHALVYHERLKKVILLNGYQGDETPTLGEVWAWDGKAWQLLPGGGPTARSLSGAVYDSKRQRIIEFGGAGSVGYEDTRGDTWEWDGKNWREVKDRTVGTRDHHSMAYDAARGRTVMYGGQNKDRTWSADTWEYDGKHWSKTATAGGPGARIHFALAYDASRRTVLLFGGSTQDGRVHNDTWEWNGNAWRKAASNGPTARSHHRMAFDSHTGTIVLYGGVGPRSPAVPGLNVLSDMWTWDGKTWTEIRTEGPGKRLLHAMAYDAGRRRLVLYGGEDGRKLFDDTWEWDGRAWTHML